MSTAEAAEYLGVKPATLRGWAKRELVPYHKLPGGRDLRFHPAELDAAMGLDVDAAAQHVRNTDFTRPPEQPDEEDAA